MKTLAIIYCAIFTLVFAGCSHPTYVPVQQQTIPVQETQYVDATLVAGKTTKQYVLDTLGTPGSVSDRSLSYQFYGKKMKNTNARLSITMKDGTNYNLIFGEKEQHRFLIIYFDKKGIIDSLSF